jgi:hypothetical protein
MGSAKGMVAEGTTDAIGAESDTSGAASGDFTGSTGFTGSTLASARRCTGDGPAAAGAGASAICSGRGGHTGAGPGR